METLHPGVYIQEIPSGLRPIEGVSTSNGAFIGKAQMGPLNKAKLVTNPQEFEANYGDYLSDSSLSHAVHQFFNNGGKKTYVVRIAGSGAAAADISIKDRKGAPTKTLTVRAANEGTWGNKLDVAITNGTADPDNEFAIRVYRDRSDLVPPLLPLLLETHDNLSMNSSASNFVENVIAANSKYISAVVNTANSSSAAAGTSRSGQLAVGNGALVLKLGVQPGHGGTETVGGVGTAGTSRSGVNPSTNPPADQRKFMIKLNDEVTAQEVTIPPTPATGADVAAAIQTAVRALTAGAPPNQPAFNGFTCTFETAAGPTNPSYLLTSGMTGATSAVVVTDSTAVPISEASGGKFTIYIDGDGPHVVTLAGPLANGATIAGAIQTAVQALTPKRAANASAFAPPPGPGFLCTYDTSAAAGNPSLLLTSGTPAGIGRLKSSVRVTDGPSQNVAGRLKLGLTNFGVEVGGSAILRPANSKVPAFPGDTEYHLGDAVVSGNIDVGMTFGSDGATPLAPDYKNGFPALDVIRDVNIVAVPGNGDLDIVAFGANYCAVRGDCFFIGDTKRDDDNVEEAQAFITGLTVKSSYGAVYFPWLKMADPTGRSAEPILAPPSGFVAGMFARIDARRGVWKAPAGTEANIGGAVGLVSEITDVQQDFLNPIGMNVIRQFPASGLVIWGSRTLATRSDPEYRYVPVRRTAIYLEQSIYNGIQWAVFEPNDEDLWASLRLNVGAFMTLQFRAGAFQGKSAKDAFFVKCDNETTTQGDIDAGIVNILVGFAPLKPAEFVVLKLTQIVGQQA
jgi:phage tail sheath protein FI